MPYKRKRKNKGILSKWRKPDMDFLATQAAVAVIQRVSTKGLGSDDKPLKKHRSFGKGKSYQGGAYSQSHGRLRDKGGKYGRIKIGGNLPVNRVTLSVTGRMLQQFRVIRTSIRRFSASVGATGGSKKYAKHVNALRPWIKLSDNDKRIVTNVFRTLMARKARR